MTARPTWRLYECPVHGLLEHIWREGDGTAVCPMHVDYSSCGMTVEGPITVEKRDA